MGNELVKRIGVDKGNWRSVVEESIKYELEAEMGWELERDRELRGLPWGLEMGLKMEMGGGIQRTELGQ